ncbi:unnamed protein product [Phytomonas sp. EM1]|nr:unnamed protein product [Phytomonas sp. EM1]|eukprot:CCW63683.1 unnamed protein product [Phytomonas sp. isolate EM1]
MSAISASVSKVYWETAKSSISRWIVRPAVKVVQSLEHRSQRRLAMVEPETMKFIQTHEASGSDAARALTKIHLKQQRQLLYYRFVRLFAEFRYLLSGQYFKNYTIKDFVQDTRMFTQALFIFIMAVMVGRQSVFPPIDPDSPFVLGLTQKVNPNY